MPQLSGFETTRLIIELCKQSNVQIPMIVGLTANEDVNKIREMSQQCGQTKLIQKPIKVEQITELFT